MRVIFEVFICIFFLLQGCKTVDIEEKVALDKKVEYEEEKKEKEIIEKIEEEQRIKDEEGLGVEYEIEPIYIPVTQYIVRDEPELQTVKPQKEGKEAVIESMKEAEIKLKDYVGSTSFFDYDENYQYPIFTRPFSMSIIMLNDDEYMVNEDQVYCSDSLRWILQGDIFENGKRQIVMIMPKESGLKADLFIMTNKRTYRFVLYSTKNEYQSLIKFRYKEEKKFSFKTRSDVEKMNKRYETEFYNEIDWSKVSVNYTLTTPLFQKKIEWMPKMVFDDGSFTYIILPTNVLQKDFPLVWGGKGEILNTLVDGENHNIIKINKLIDKIVLKNGKEKVTIKKKVGESIEVDELDTGE